MLLCTYDQSINSTNLFSNGEDIKKCLSWMIGFPLTDGIEATLITAPGSGCRITSKLAYGAMVETALSRLSPFFIDDVSTRNGTTRTPSLAAAAVNEQ